MLPSSKIPVHSVWSGLPHLTAQFIREFNKTFWKEKSFVTVLVITRKWFWIHSLCCVKENINFMNSTELKSFSRYIVEYFIDKSLEVAMFYWIYVAKRLKQKSLSKIYYQFPANTEAESWPQDLDSNIGELKINERFNQELKTFLLARSMMRRKWRILLPANIWV